MSEIVKWPDNDSQPSKTLQLQKWICIRLMFCRYVHKKQINKPIVITIYSNEYLKIICAHMLPYKNLQFIFIILWMAHHHAQSTSMMLRNIVF